MKLYGLYKNGKIAKISQDGNHLESDAWELTEDEQLLNLTKNKWTVREIPNDLEFTKPRSNISIGLKADGGPQLTRSTADVIGRALERCEDSSIDWQDDSEFKSRKTIDKINNMR